MNKVADLLCSFVGLDVSVRERISECRHMLRTKRSPDEYADVVSFMPSSQVTNGLRETIILAFTPHISNSYGYINWLNPTRKSNFTEYHQATMDHIERLIQDAQVGDAYKQLKHAIINDFFNHVERINNELDVAAIKAVDHTDMYKVRDGKLHVTENAFVYLSKIGWCQRNELTLGDLLRRTEHGRNIGQIRKHDDVFWNIGPGTEKWCEEHQNMNNDLFHAFHEWASYHSDYSPVQENIFGVFNEDVNNEMTNGFISNVIDLCYMFLIRELIGEDHPDIFSAMMHNNYEPKLSGELSDFVLLTLVDGKWSDTLLLSKAEADHVISLIDHKNL